MPTKVVQKKVSELNPDPNNPRKNEHAVNQMARMIADFGFRVPILVRGNDVVDGHLRLKAAHKIKLDTVPTIDVSDMADKDVKAFRIAVNRAAEFAEWDDDLLADMIKALDDEGYEIESTGFSADELDKLLGEADEEPTTPNGSTSTSSHLTVGLQFRVTKEDRDKVNDALERVREAHHLSTRADALVKLAEEVE